MSRLYGEQHRALQDAFGTRRMADRIEEIAMKTEIGDLERAFIESRDFFFLASSDERGRPTVSYKGGAPGFLKVLDANTIAFPSYDGNGMYLSMGNIAGNAEAGLLLIDFERPFRIRIQGRATVSADDPLRGAFKEAELIVRVAVSELWMNCPRYIHRHSRASPARHVPEEGHDTPLCEWKRIDAIQDVLRPHEAAAVAKVGTIGIEEWMGRVQSGAEDA